MHQPQYRDAFSGQYTLPWTYLHAIKDYTDMAAHLEANPAARAVVNFTPVLIEQLEEIAARVAEHLASGAPLPDPVLALLGPGPGAGRPAAAPGAAARLPARAAQADDRALRSVPRAGRPSPRRSPPPSASPTPPTSCIHDLAVWYHLAWLGETVRRADPLVGRAHRARPRLQRRAAPQTPRADRRPGGRGAAALPHARRSRASASCR